MFFLFLSQNFMYWSALGKPSSPPSYYCIRGRFHEASFVFSFLKVKEGGFLTFGKASLKLCFTKPPLFHLTKDFP